MELTPLKSFLLLAEEANMTRAARRLHLTQPAVSTQLSRLEDELGQRLFHRTPKGLVLTSAGTLFRGYVEDALRRLNDGASAIAELAGLQRGSLSLGGGATATTYLLPPLLATFHADYPAIRFYVREQGSRGVVEAVLAGELELGIITLPLSSRDRHLTVEAWLVDEMRLIVPPTHRLAKRRRFAMGELDGESLVQFEAGSAVRALIDGALATAGATAEVVMELRSIESIKQMVAQGIGAAFVSRYALAADQGMTGLTCEDARLARELALVYRSDRRLSPVAQEFLLRLKQATPR